MRKDAQLNMPLNLPKTLMYGNGMAQTNPNKLNTISGTQIQWINSLLGF